MLVIESILDIVLVKIIHRDTIGLNWFDFSNGHIIKAFVFVFLDIRLLRKDLNLACVLSYCNESCHDVVVVNAMTSYDKLVTL